jgi:sec-independent protein translocase protein TatA
MQVGPGEILVILVVALLVFGPQKLPELARQVGSAMRELRKMQDSVRGELDMVLHPEHGTSASAAQSIESPIESPIEPADHTAVDGVSDTGDVTSIEVEPPDPDGVEHKGVDDPGFSGPDSFI